LKGHGFSRAESAAEEDAALAAEGMHVVEKKLPLGLKSDSPLMTAICLPICGSLGPTGAR
jgi:hypothetical protein